MKDFSYTLELSDDIIKRINARRRGNKKKASLIEWRVQRQGRRYVNMPNKKNPSTGSFLETSGEVQPRRL